MTDREKLLAKIRALLAKKIDHGCTEEEALAALAKARAMMDAYEVSETELQLIKTETAILRSEPPGSRDPHNIKTRLAPSVARYCDCRAWRGSNGLVFCGLRPDVQFATWLLDHLAGFVQAELTRHLMTCIEQRGERRRVINGFVMGCTGRISQRLDELVEQSAKKASGNSTALVVAKGALITSKMEALDIHLVLSRSRRQYDEAAFEAGRAAGERASFGRPVSRDVPRPKLGSH
jgi:hypothetical protein